MRNGTVFIAFFLLLTAPVAAKKPIERGDPISKQIAYLDHLKSCSPYLHKTVSPFDPAEERVSQIEGWLKGSCRVNKSVAGKAVKECLYSKRSLKLFTSEEQYQNVRSNRSVYDPNSPIVKAEAADCRPPKKSEQVVEKKPTKFERFKSDKEVRAWLKERLAKRADTTAKQPIIKRRKIEVLEKEAVGAFFGSNVSATPEEKKDLLFELINRWQELPDNTKQRLLPLMLPPTDPRSVVYPFKRRQSGVSVKPGAMTAVLDSLITKVHAGDDPPEFDGDWHVLSSSVYGDRVQVLFPNPGGSGPYIAQPNFTSDMTMATEAMAVLETALPRFLQFLGKSEHDIKFPIRAHIVDTTASGKPGVALACNNIQFKRNLSLSAFSNPTAIRRSLYAHELFHCVQFSLGIWRENNLTTLFSIFQGVFDCPDTSAAWMREGSARFSEHIAYPADDTEIQLDRGVVHRYLTNPNRSFFETSYDGSLIWYVLAMNQGDSKAAQLINGFASDKSCKSMTEKLRDDWHQVWLDVSDSDVVYSQSVGKRPIDSGSGAALSTNLVGTQPNGQVITLDNWSSMFMPIDLPWMSANIFRIELGGEIPSKGEFVRFDLGQLGGSQSVLEDIEISVAINGDNTTVLKQITPRQDPDTGNWLLDICINKNAICDNNSEAVYKYHENASEMDVIITNRGQLHYSGDGVVTPSGPGKYQLQMALLNGGERRVPVKGSFTVNVNTTDEDSSKRGLFTESNNHWMAFPHDFYKWESKPGPEPTRVKVHPTRFTRYVNDLCRFRGHMGYEIEDVSVERLEDGWIKKKFKIKKKSGDEGSGNFYRTKHRFVCGKPPIPPGMMGIAGMAFQATYAKMLAAINATKYGPGSFAMNLRHIFARNVSLGLIGKSGSESEGEVEMEFYGDQLLRIKYGDNLEFHYAKE